MTTRTIIAIMVLGFLSSLAVAGPDTLAPEHFRHYGAIEGPLKKNILYRSHLAGEVLEKCNARCGDLRIIDTGGQEIPYVIIEHRANGKAPEAYDVEIIGLEELSSGTQVLMKVMRKHGPIARLALDIPEKDFSRTVLLEGSKDRKSWVAVGRKQVYDFSSQVELRKTTLDFPPSDFDYFRLAFENDRKAKATRERINLKYQGLDFIADGLEGKKLRISKVTGHGNPEKEAQPAYDTYQLTTFAVAQDKDRNTVISFSTGLPFTKVVFDVSNPYFYRQVSCYAGGTEKKTRQPLLSASVYRFLLSDKVEAHTSLDCAAAGGGLYEIVIANGNNPPLDIRGVRLEWIRKELYFVALDDVPSYAVRFGNPAMEGPSYDLAKSVHQANWRNFAAHEVEIAGVQENLSFRAATPEDVKAEREKRILVMVLCALVIGMGFWLYVLFARSGKTKPPDAG